MLSCKLDRFSERTAHSLRGRLGWLSGDRFNSSCQCCICALSIFKTVGQLGNERLSSLFLDRAFTIAGEARQYVQDSFLLSMVMLTFGMKTRIEMVYRG